MTTATDSYSPFPEAALIAAESRIEETRIVAAAWLRCWSNHPNVRPESIAAAEAIKEGKHLCSPYTMRAIEQIYKNVLITAPEGKHAVMLYEAFYFRVAEILRREGLLDG